VKVASWSLEEHVENRWTSIFEMYDLLEVETKNGNFTIRVARNDPLKASLVEYGANLTIVWSEDNGWQLSSYTAAGPVLQTVVKRPNDPSHYVELRHMQIEQTHVTQSRHGPYWYTLYMHCAPYGFFTVKVGWDAYEDIKLHGAHLNISRERGSTEWQLYAWRIARPGCLARP
jgi:hypothetical protein